MAELICRNVMMEPLIVNSDDTADIGFESVVRQWVIFPAYSTKGFRLRPSHLLVEAENGMIFFVKTMARLPVVESTIEDIAAAVGSDNPYWPDTKAFARLKETGIPLSLFIEAIDDVSGSWLTPNNLAEGLLDFIATRKIGTLGNLRAEYADLQRSILNVQITRFISRLDPSVVEVITASGNKLTPVAYNFFFGTRERISLYRKQAAKAYPALLQRLAIGGLKGVRKAIDTAAPLHDAIVSELGVRPAAVRALRGLDAGFVSHWSSKPAVLLRLLSALPVHLYPTDRESWLLFQRRVEAVTKISGLPALALRNRVMLAAACASGKMEMDNLEGSLQEELLAVEELSSALATALLWQLHDVRLLNVRHCSHFAAVAVDEFMASHNINTITKIAKRYKAALIKEQALLADENKLLAGVQFFKIKGTPFVYQDKSIYPIVSAEECRMEGEVFGNCLADYALRLFSAAALVFSVRDLQGRERYSALEIAVNDKGERPSAYILQHRTRQNHAPSDECSQAVRGFVSYLNHNPQFLTEFLEWKSRISKLPRHDSERMVVINQITKALGDSLPKAWPLSRVISIAVAATKGSKS